MPTFVQSAMNPNGTWQADAMDQSEQANRQAAFQAAQMQNQIAAEQLRAHLEQQHMAQQGSQFEEGRADTLGMHGQDIENQNRMQQAGFGHEDARMAAEIASRNHLADVQFGPESLAAKQYADSIAQRQLLMHALGFDGGQAAGGAPSGMPAHADAVTGAETALGAQFHPGITPMPTGAPAGAAPAAGGMQVPQGVDPMAYRVGMLNAVLHGTQMPDFTGNALRTRAGTDELHQHELDIASRRLQQAIDSGDTATQQQILHDNPDLVMPRIDAQSIAGRPDVQFKLSALDQLAERATKFAGDTGAVASLKLAMSDAIHTLTSHGVKPEEASAIVNQRVLQRIPQRYGSFGAGLNDIVSAFAGGAPYWMGDGDTKADRTNAIHDFIGQ